MVAVKGRLRNNTFISEEDVFIPNNAQVILTVLDAGSNRQTAKEEMEQEVDEFYGAWQGNQTAEEIIAIIREGKGKSTREIQS